MAEKQCHLGEEMTLSNPKTRTGKGNIPINRTIAKKIDNGFVIQELPLVNFLGTLVTLFSVISPTMCSICGSHLNVNQHYSRYVLSSYGVLEIPVTYWECSNQKCKKHVADEIAGVRGSANYCDEYLLKQKYVRYDGKCSLWNTRSVGEIHCNGRAPCPTTLWTYEQKDGKISYEKLTTQDFKFDGELYIDGYWVKTGWKKFIESQVGKELSKKEWKKYRYKVIYVVATKDKVIIDFQITNRRPSYLELIPLINRIKDRFSEKKIKKVVSDEDSTIIDSIKLVLPKAKHSFCVFHKMKNVTQKYIDEFKELENIPAVDKEIYLLTCELIRANDVILLTILFQTILDKALKNKISLVSKKIVDEIKEIYRTHRILLEKGFTPETNNTMEEIFSMLDDFVYQARSFKTIPGLKNFFSNLFYIFNHRAFNSGKWKGFSPLERVKTRLG